MWDPRKKRKRRQECCGCCEKCVTIGLCITRFRSTGFSRWKVSVESDAESLGTNSKSTIHNVYATSSEYPGKERTIVGKNKCQSSSSAKSLRNEIWGQVPWGDRTTATMCPKQGLESCPKNFTSSKKKTMLHSTFPRRNGYSHGYSRLRQQKSGRKESL